MGRGHDPADPAGYLAQCIFYCAMVLKNQVRLAENLLLRRGHDPALQLLAHAEAFKNSGGDIFPYGGAGDLAHGGHGLLHVGEHCVGG